MKAESLQLAEYIAQQLLMDQSRELDKLKAQRLLMRELALQDGDKLTVDRTLLDLCLLLLESERAGY